MKEYIEGKGCAKKARDCGSTWSKGIFIGKQEMNVSCNEENERKKKAGKQKWGNEPQKRNTQSDGKICSQGRTISS